MASILSIIILMVFGSKIIVSDDSIYENCPKGTYRETQYTKECKLCPKGYYGNTEGLTTPTCTAPCPIGRYSDRFGLKYVDDCKLVSI